MDSYGFWPNKCIHRFLQFWKKCIRIPVFLMYSDSEVQKLKVFGFGEISTSANINMINFDLIHARWRHDFPTPCAPARALYDVIKVCQFQEKMLQMFQVFLPATQTNRNTFFHETDVIKVCQTRPTLLASAHSLWRHQDDHDHYTLRRNNYFLHSIVLCIKLCCTFSW